MKSKLLMLACVVLVVPWPALGSVDCATCHEQPALSMARNVHMRARAFEVGGHVTGCEGCHGDGARHAAEGDPSLIRKYQEPVQWNTVCLECHAKKHQTQWAASRHASEGVACVDCHKVHQTNKRAVDACASCHAEVVAMTQLPSHHPIREGHMTCASCHDAHSANEALLKTKQRVNDLCYTCHQAQEGPFIFEHEPVQEDCRTCHTPHGSVSNNLLTANEPMLCLQCHDMHFQSGYTAASGPITIGGNVRNNPLGAQSFNVGISTKCTQCHSRIHGSDLASQSVPGQGRALTR